jgi:transposase-like protein
VGELFEGRHLDREVIILCVRWDLRFKLSLQDLVEMMAERGLSMARTSIMRRESIGICGVPTPDKRHSGLIARG